jgi:hypothetical protein
VGGAFSEVHSYSLIFITDSSLIHRACYGALSTIEDKGTREGEAMNREQVDEANIRGMSASVDRMDPDEFASCFTEDGSFRFGNAEPVVGRSAIREAAAAFFSTIDGVHHDIQGIWSGKWEQGEVYSVEAEATYTRKDGSEVKLPVTSTLRMKGDLVQDWRVFMDISPVYAER